MTYTRSFQEFDEDSKDEFFNLGNPLGKENVPNIRLAKKRNHKLGILQLLAKRKIIVKIESGEVDSWAQLEWRPIQGCHNYVWGPEESHIGKTFTAMSKVSYPLGDGVDNPKAIQKKPLVHTTQHLGEPGQY